MHPFHAVLGLFELHGNIFLTFGGLYWFFILQKWYFLSGCIFLYKKQKVIELEEDEKEDEGAAKVWRLGREGVKLYWPPPFSATSDYSGQEEQAGAPTILPSSRPSLYPVPVPPKLYGAQSWLHRAVGAWPTGFKERPPFILHRCVNTATEEPPHFPPDLHNSSPVHLLQSHLPFQLSHCVHLQDMAIWAASCQLAVKPSGPQGLIPPPPQFVLLLLSDWSYPQKSDSGLSNHRKFFHENKNVHLYVYQPQLIFSFLWRESSGKGNLTIYKFLLAQSEILNA